ncbi:unnamed protein product, partial [Schistosoma margrebowiei]
CVSREAQHRILSLIASLWPELSTFVPYSNQFVQLSIHLLNSYPNWSGRAELIEQVIWILMQRLEAMKRHPNRTLYSVLMHFAHSQKGLLPGVFIPLESVERSGSLDRVVNEFTFLQPTKTTTTTTDSSSTSRSWASLAAQKQNITQVPSTSNSNNGTPDTVVTDLNSNLFNDFSTSINASNSPFTFELEPCLLCHAKVIDEPFYVIFRWDSEPNVSRRSIQSVVSTIYNSRFTHQFRQSPIGNLLSQNPQRTTTQQSNMRANGTGIC